MSSESIELRSAVEDDCALLFQMTGEFADYIGSGVHMTATEDKIRDALFRKNAAEALIAFRNGEPAGFCVFYRSYAVWYAEQCLFLDGIFVREAHRRAGIGDRLFAQLGVICRERGYPRLELLCRDWNKNSIAFYLKKGGKHFDGLGVYRFDSDAIALLADMADK